MLLHNSPYKLFEDLLFADQNTTLYPFSQKDESFEAVLEVPGFGKDNLKVEIEEDYVKLNGEAAAKNELSADATNCRRKPTERNYQLN